MEEWKKTGPAWRGKKIPLRKLHLILLHESKAPDYSELTASACLISTKPAYDIECFAYLSYPVKRLKV